jgi:hypothetical protein
MPVVTGVITEDGAVISVLVGVSENRRRALQRVGFAVPPSVAVLAVIDTGSFATGLRPSIFDALGIQPFRTLPILTPSTKPDQPHICGQYDVSLTLVSGVNQLEIPSVHAIGTDDFREEGIQGIIGRDVLKRCVLNYYGPHATFELAFPDVP